jgi:hypothetical protein
MHLRFFSRSFAFKDLLDQVDTATRAIQLVAQQLISRTSRGAKTAVHTTAQNGISLLALRGVLDEVCEIGLH